MSFPLDFEATMPNLLQFDPGQFVGFLIIFTRISGVLVIAPILGDANIPAQVKVAFAFLLSLIFFPVVAAPNLGATPLLSDVAFISLTEFGVGLMIGFAARLMFTAVGLAGEVIGFQMGVGIANIFDPTSETQVALIGQIQIIFALLLFVVLDGHHIFIKALAESYQIIAPGGVSLSAGDVRYVTALVGRIFLLGLQIGAPMIVALMAANFSMGLITRSVPQLNVIMVGIPFTIGLGLIFLVAGFPFFIRALVVMNERLESVLMMLLKALG